jgi:hypothetical protein
MMMPSKSPTLSSNKTRVNWRSVLIWGLLFFSWNLSAADSVKEKDGEIAGFLNKAKRAIAQDRLTTPRKDNAFNYVEQALAISPEHPEAIMLLEQITDRYDALVATRLKHGEQMRQKSLTQAKNFHERAQNILDQHSISNASLVSMKYKIAKYEASLNVEKDINKDKKRPNAAIETLVDQHITLSESALEEGNIREAQWHTRQAVAMTQRYGLSNRKLELLQDRILTNTATGKKRDTKAIKALVASHVKLSENALSKGDNDKAQMHQSIAEEMVLQYGINNPRLSTPSPRGTKQSAWNESDTWLKIFGTF